MPLSDGSGPRQDASSIVVLDGLMEDDEQDALLSWLTADGWDGIGDAPPDDKWARNCVDHVDHGGDAGPSGDTWGLQEHMVQACSLCGKRKAREEVGIRVTGALSRGRHWQGLCVKLATTSAAHRSVPVFCSCSCSSTYPTMILPLPCPRA